MSVSRSIFRQQRVWTTAASICWRCQRRSASQITNTAGRAPSSGFQYVESVSQAAQNPVLAQAQGLTVPSLGEFEPSLIKHGIPGLMTQYPFQQAWHTYQQHLVKNLNKYTINTAYWNKDPKVVALATARDPRWAAMFNYASMAHNNHFFFKGVNLDGAVSTGPSSQFTDALCKSFDSMETLKKEFLMTAYTMFGPGFVWLVQKAGAARNREFYILNTYLAGSPYHGAHNRQQGLDMNTQNPRSARESGWGGKISVPGMTSNREIANSVGSFGQYSSVGRERDAPLPGGINLLPILCVNTWEHNWLIDYTIEGKYKYLENWWDRINWNEVEERSSGRNRSPV